eukprot:symbB.v1.2.011716.t1/scaffold790.1/size295610/8
MSSSVIGISGKTTLAEHLATRLRDEGVRVEIVHQDWHWQRSSLNKTAEGKRTWEGPQFTDWAWLEWSVMEAKQRASVVIVAGYLLNDCSTALFDSLDLLFLVESTKEQCLSRRTSFPSDWPSSMAYAEACVWPVHEEYMHRAAQRMASPPEKLCNMKAAPVLRLPVDQDTSTRAAFAWTTIPSNVVRLASHRSQDEPSPVQFASQVREAGAWQQKGAPKLTITVVSDTNLVPLLAMYGLKHASSRRPPYLSALVHEMYQHNNGSWFVRVLYNGRVQKVCDERYPLCPLNEWDALVESFTPSNQACPVLYEAYQFTTRKNHKDRQWKDWKGVPPAWSDEILSTAFVLPASLGALCCFCLGWSCCPRRRLWHSGSRCHCKLMAFVEVLMHGLIARSFDDEEGLREALVR